MKALILYSEISGYTIACLQACLDRKMEIHLVRWPVHPDAPFQFGDIPGMTQYDRETLDIEGLHKLADKVKPDLILIAGWVDKEYLKFGSAMKKKGLPVVGTMDNQWFATRRQKAATLLSKYYFRRFFTHLWVPGLFQYEYARRLGFPRENIRTGVYSADTEPFYQIFKEEQENRAQKWPKKLFYVGRFIELKGIDELYASFNELSPEFPEWELELVGTGPLKDRYPATDKVHVRDFVQPWELPEIAREAGAFVLPSRSEAWGVVLHEFASAGVPLVASTACGAIAAFLRDGYNGFLHHPSDKKSLKSALRHLFQLEQKELEVMGLRSAELSRQITPASWAETLLSILEEYA